MNYKIETVPDFRQNSVDLANFSGSNLVFLPENLDDVQEPKEFIYSETTSDLRKYFRLEKISLDYLTADKPVLRARKSADWFGPTLFVGYSIFSENSALINICLNLLSNYLYDIFKGTSGSKKIKFEIVIETKKNSEFKKISYDGDHAGVKELIRTINELNK